MSKRIVTYAKRGGAKRTTATPSPESSVPRSPSPPPDPNSMLAKAKASACASTFATSAATDKSSKLLPHHDAYVFQDDTLLSSAKETSGALRPQGRKSNNTTKTKRVKHISDDEDYHDDAPVLGEGRPKTRLQSWQNPNPTTTDPHYKKGSSPPKRKIVSAPLELDIFQYDKTSSVLVSPVKASSNKSIAKSSKPAASKPIKRLDGKGPLPIDCADYFGARQNVRTPENTPPISGLPMTALPRVPSMREVVGMEALGGASRSRLPIGSPTVSTTAPSAMTTRSQALAAELSIQTIDSISGTFGLSKSAKIDLKLPPPPKKGGKLNKTVNITDINIAAQCSNINPQGDAINNVSNDRHRKGTSKDSMDWEPAFAIESSTDSKPTVFDSVFNQQDVPETQPLVSLSRTYSKNEDKSLSPQRSSRIACMQSSNKSARSLSPTNTLTRNDTPHSDTSPDRDCSPSNTQKGPSKLNNPNLTNAEPAGMTRSSSSVIAAPVTYGRTRTILANAADELGSTNKFISLHQQYRDEGLEDSDEEEDKTIKSMHEMRVAGETKRFYDEMTYMLDGLQDRQPLGVVRTSCLAIGRKLLLQPAFIGQVRAHDFLFRVYGCLLRRKDNIHKTDSVVLSTILVTIGSLMLQDARNVIEISSEAGCLDFIVAGLKLQPDPFITDLRSKFDKNFFKDVVTLLNESDLGKGKASNCLEIALTCLAAIITNPPPRVTDVLSVLLAQPAAVEVITSSLSSWLGSVREEVIKWRKKGNQTGSKIDVNLLNRVEGTLRLLEFMVTSGIQHPSIVGLSNELADGLVWLSSITRSCSEREAITVAECLIAMLALIVNLTHEDQQAAQRFAETNIRSCIIRCMVVQNPVFADTGDDRHNNILQANNVDLVVTSVGLIINLMEKTDVDMGQTLINLDCGGHGVCFGVCKCEAEQTLLDAICELYKKHDFSDNSSRPESALITAYYALLLGMLFKSMPMIQVYKTLDSLPNGKDGMMAILEELAVFQELVANITEGSKGDGPALSRRRRSSFFSTSSNDGGRIGHSRVGEGSTQQYDSDVAKGVARVITWLKQI
ncbi:hypothetical protein SeLEV6574_g03693 [Synchytrium endobioticum]|uniref:Wings apart-like protein C-terminal domain-containing protein n=1 Tax=Synchytrium endobioticum TaxID=286115 RepID=A0A507D2U7_9FUNG|nr:hypothetical protein SeLEV6574_g03693 [Synchytrium endobioticum]